MAETLRHDRWLSGIIGKDAYALDASVDSLGLQDALTQLQSKSGVFCFTKVRVDDVARCTDLEDAGFRIIDTGVLFATQKPVLGEPVSSITVRSARSEDRIPVREIARSAFRFSRFHLDPRISNQSANELKAAWAENFFDGKRGDKMLIAERGDQVVGFAQLLCPSPDLTVIDLVAVKIGFHGQGIGKALVAASDRTRSRDGCFKIGTQLANLPSTRLYAHCGLTLESAQYIFHYHAR